MNFLRLLKEIHGDNNDNKISTSRPEPRPTTYPTIVDPNDPDKWITDPEWIQENIRNLKR